MECQNRTPLDTIESRLSNIERRVYGKSNPSFREKEDAASEVIICNGFVFQLVSSNPPFKKYLIITSTNLFR